MSVFVLFTGAGQDPSGGLGAARARPHLHAPGADDRPEGAATHTRACQGSDPAQVRSRPVQELLL